MSNIMCQIRIFSTDMILQAINRFGQLRISLPLKPIINVISLHIRKLPGDVIKNIPYRTTIVLENMGNLTVYNVSIKAPVTSNIKVNISSSSLAIFKGKSSEEIPVCIKFIKPGNIMFNFSATYIFGGFKHTISSNVINISVHKGLSAKITPLYVRTIEGSVININLSIARDIYVIREILLQWSIPKGLKFENDSLYIEKTIAFNNSRVINLNIKIKCIDPSQYIVNPPSIYFLYNGNRYSYTIIGGHLSEIRIYVYENLIKRYWIYFIPILIFLLINVFIIRRTYLRFQERHQSEIRA